MRTFTAICGWLVIAAGMARGEGEPRAAQTSRQVWQPVQEYFVRINPQQKPIPYEGTKRLNSFLNYTHIGTDFGFHGPAEHDLEWSTDEIGANLLQQPDAWAGMWHSLAGLARSPNETLDFSRAYPRFILPAYQPRVTSVSLNAAGKGRIKLEIKGADQATLWDKQIDIDSPNLRSLSFPVPAEALDAAKFLNWTSEPQSQIRVGGIGLGLELPPMEFDRYVFAASLAKLGRCYSPFTGLVRDRAHLGEGSFDSVPASGLFALAAAAASREPLSMVEPAFAAETLNRVTAATRGLRSPGGLLPHFVHSVDGHLGIHPGTEYSTVDTAIYYHAVLLAAHILGNQGVIDETLANVREIDFNRLRNPDGSTTHGLRDDGVTLLPYSWRDWGGESALVAMLERIANDQSPGPQMIDPGKPWQGSGFIAEIQNLFYPDFDADRPDAPSGVNWGATRRSLLKEQQAYFTLHAPQGPAATLGWYGLSAGENEFGSGYAVGGVSLPDQRLIHPHYILMSGTAADRTEDVYDTLRRLEKAGYFPPWGLVENFTADGKSYLPMIGSMNAGFEALGAYHLMARHRGETDLIHQASLERIEFRRAAAMFYPTKLAEAKQAGSPQQAPAAGR